MLIYYRSNFEMVISQFYMNVLGGCLCYFFKLHSISTLEFINIKSYARLSQAKHFSPIKVSLTH